MHDFQIWIIAGLIISTTEVISPGSFYGICFGLAAIITGCLSAIIDISLNVQVTIFFVITAIMFIGIRPFILKYMHSDNEQTNADAMIGKIYLVTESINNNKDVGYIKCGSEHWRARSVDNENIKAKAHVKVVKIEGSTTYVVKN